MMATTSREYYTRPATHAGSWYERDPSQLKKQLQEWLDNADEKKNSTSTTRGIIAPHAGYRFSGSTAAYAYKHLQQSSHASNMKRIFLLGPSHHHYLCGCAVTSAQIYETPLKGCQIDQQVTSALMKTGKFEVMSSSVDEDEHSLEIHLPFIAHVMEEAKNYQYALVPILVGSISPAQEESYGKILAPYFDDPLNFFIISSDFCHWGYRFRYQPTLRGVEICESIKSLDHEGITLIEAQDIGGFHSYLSKTNNTICGRHPIGVLLNAVFASNESDGTVIQFVKYSQSSQCKTMDDSSVSYASAVIF